MKWRTWTRFTAVVFFIIAVLTFYFTYSGQVMENDAFLEFENFPTETDLDSLEIDQKIDFSFFLYNTGDSTAFVDRVFVYLLDEDGNLIREAETILPDEDFSITGSGDAEVLVSLSAPNEEESSYLSIEVYYDDEQILTSEPVPVTWGTLL
tara:strand:+ start:527 stop:979 length:453 start_codon:yes stop_codon:yes gene_type:complete